MRFFGRSWELEVGGELQVVGTLCRVTLLGNDGRSSVEGGTLWHVPVFLALYDRRLVQVSILGLCLEVFLGARARSLFGRPASFGFLVWLDGAQKLRKTLGDDEKDEKEFSRQR